MGIGPHGCNNDAFLAASALLAGAAAPVPEWPFPGLGNADPQAKPEPETVVHLSGSDAVFHETDLHGIACAID